MTRICWRRIDELWYLAGFYLTLENSAAAEDILLEIIRTDSSDAFACYQLALLKANNGEKRIAEQYLACAASLDDTSKDILHEYAYCLHYQGKYAESNLCLEKLARLGFCKVEIATSLGINYAKLGDKDNQKKYLKEAAEAVEAGSIYPIASYHYALFNWKTGNLEAAIRGFEKLITEKPDWIGPYQSLMRIFLAKRLPDQAERVLGTGLENNPGNVNLLLDVVVLARITGKAENLTAPEKKQLHEIPGYFNILHNTVLSMMKEFSQTTAL